EKHGVTPGVPKPARELYGVMLLERNLPDQALTAFEATLKKEPNRLGAYIGAAAAARTSGDTAKARLYCEQIVTIAGNADKTRTEVAEARAYLKNNLGPREHAVGREVTPAAEGARRAGNTGRWPNASGHRLCGRARRVGIDRHRHADCVVVDDRAQRPAGDDACRVVRAGWA